MALRVLHDLLENSVKKFPNKNCLIHKESALTYNALFDQSSKLSNVLSQYGIKKGDRVSIYLEKRVEKVISIFGISMAGAVIVPMRRLLHENQVGHIISDCNAKVLITTEDRISKLLEVDKGLESLELIVSVSANKHEPEQLFKNVQILNWNTALESAKPLPPQQIVEMDLAAILYTSGSTGNPKGVVLTHLNIVEGAKKVSEYLKITKDDKLLSILTFAFDYGLNQLTSAVLCGAQIVLLDYLFPKDIIKTVNQHNITGLAAVATTWIQLLQTEWNQNDVPTLRYITNTGGAVPELYVKELRTRIPKTDIYLMYGLTEAFRSTYLDPKFVDVKPTSIGKAIPGEEILVLNDDNKPVKPGEIGQLVHRGVLVAQGYWNAPELTAERYKTNPLQHPEIPVKEIVVFSGDYVKIDDEGFLYFIGRKDEMIKSAGNRISPTEVENVLYDTGSIKDAIVMGIPHNVYGQAIKAIIVFKEDKEMSIKEISDFCKKILPPYMIPSDIEIREKLAVNANGKLDRAKVKKEVLAEFNKGLRDE